MFGCVCLRVLIFLFFFLADLSEHNSFYLCSLHFISPVSGNGVSLKQNNVCVSMCVSMCVCRHVCVLGINVCTFAPYPSSFALPFPSLSFKHPSSLLVMVGVEREEEEEEEGRGLRKLRGKKGWG